MNLLIDPSKYNNHFLQGCIYRQKTLLLCNFLSNALNIVLYASQLDRYLMTPIPPMRQ